MKVSTILLSIAAVGVAMSVATGCVARRGVTVSTAAPGDVSVAGSAGSVTPAASAQGAGALVGTWAVIEVDGEEVKGASDDDYPTVTFDAAGGNVNLYVYNGCNYINGTYTVLTGGYLSRVGDLAATMKFCPDATYEIPITMAIEKMGAYRIEQIGGEYQLSLLEAGAPESQVLMRLRRHDLAFFDGAWRVESLQGVDLKGVKDAPELVIDLASEKVHGNAGCNVLNGSIVQNLDRPGGLGFTNLFTTRMACPNSAIEQSFLVALEQVESCSALPGDYNVAQLRDGAGAVIITLRRINLPRQ